MTDRMKGSTQDVLAHYWMVLIHSIYEKAKFECKSSQWRLLIIIYQPNLTFNLYLTWRFKVLWKQPKNLPALWFFCSWWPFNWFLGDKIMIFNLVDFTLRKKVLQSIFFCSPLLLLILLKDCLMTSFLQFTGKIS